MVEVTTIETVIQVQQSAQPQAPQQQQPKSSDIPIRMVGNIERQAKFEQIEFIEIEGQIELVADNKFLNATLDLEQMDDTFRGGGT
jgi:uncharacterized protein YdeI (BOF family)